MQLRTDGDTNPIEIGHDIEGVAVEAFERSRVSGNNWFRRREAGCPGTPFRTAYVPRSWRPDQ
ncbi:MAG: hypothetical protein ACR2I5_02660 [Candidatus Limnocylindria bacterium]